jgi:hypothetical protein
MVKISLESNVANNALAQCGTGGMSVCGICFFHSPLSSGQGGHAMGYSQAYRSVSDVVSLAFAVESFRG